MGYLNSSVVEIDAILTKKGRELLAKSPEDFKISKFALSDDEVDYRLWNPNHSLGTDYYGEVIENMPILEASPNETQILKYKLISLAKNTIQIPIVNIGATYVELQSTLYTYPTYIISPSTLNSTADQVLGYTATISSTKYAGLAPTPGYEVRLGTSTGSSGVEVGDASSASVHGRRFTLGAKPTTVDFSGIVTITGNESGGRVTLVFKILKLTNPAG